MYTWKRSNPKLLTNRYFLYHDIIVFYYCLFHPSTNKLATEKKYPFNDIQTPIIPHESQNLFLWHETKKSFTEIHRDSQRKSSQRYSNANRKSQNLPHDSWSTVSLKRYFTISRSFFIPFFLSPFSLDVEVRRCAL